MPYLPLLALLVMGMTVDYFLTAVNAVSVLWHTTGKMENYTCDCSCEKKNISDCWNVEVVTWLSNMFFCTSW